MKLLLLLAGIFISIQLTAQEQHVRDSAKYFADKGQHIMAMPFARRHLETAIKAGDDSAYIVAADFLGGVYSGLLKLDSALIYFEKAAEVAKKTYGVKSVQYGSVIISIGRVYADVGQHQKAKQSFQDAEAILERMGGEELKMDNWRYKVFYTNYLINASYYCIRTGNLGKAENLGLRVCETALREPVDKIAYISGLTNLSVLYEKMGQYEKLDNMLIRQFNAIKEELGETHPTYTSAMGGIADIYQRTQNFEKADSLFRKALAMRQAAIGKNDPNNIPILNRLGIVNMEMGKYVVAEEYLNEAAGLIEKNGGEEFTYYAYCMKNLARLYVLTGRKQQAEAIYQNCLAIYNKMGMELHSDRLKVLSDMAELLYADEAVLSAKYLEEAIRTESKLLLGKLDFLSETELLAYLKKVNHVLDSPYRFLRNHQDPEMASIAYNNRLLISGIGLQNTRVLYHNMAQSTDKELGILWQTYLQQKSFYTSLLLTPVAQRNANTDSIAEIINRQEKEILRRSVDYRNMKEQLAITWQDVQKHLQPGETAIEFVRFSGPDIIANSKKGTFYYAALILRPKDTAPQFVVLCEEKQLIAAMQKFPYKASVKTRGKKPTDFYQNTTNVLFQLAWQPLEPFLTDCQTIYFSPDGLLHRVAFAAMPYQTNKLLCDKYDLIQLTSSRHVALKETRASAPVSLAMFGGINYSQSAQTDKLAHPDPHAWVYRQNRSANLDSFSYLPHTLQEVEAIKSNTESSRKKSVVFTEDSATEAAFRNLSGDNSPEVIHFATHGFTLADTFRGGNAGTPFKAADNPLLRCGLVMAGGNKGWKGEVTEHEDDGILTGLEISAVQLPNTQLAVLSACETGLGKIEAGEGVFGLQRAFKLAGVNYIMSSLWQVTDKETAEFMESFYAHWLKGKTIRRAFLDTQQSMRKKYAPYYWAGFTLVR